MKRAVNISSPKGEEILDKISKGLFMTWSKKKRTELIKTDRQTSDKIQAKKASLQYVNG